MRLRGAWRHSVSAHVGFFGNMTGWVGGCVDGCMVSLLGAVARRGASERGDRPCGACGGLDRCRPRPFGRHVAARSPWLLVLGGRRLAAMGVPPIVPVCQHHMVGRVQPPITTWACGLAPIRGYECGLACGSRETGVAMSTREGLRRSTNSAQDMASCAQMHTSFPRSQRVWPKGVKSAGPSSSWSLTRFSR